MAMRRDMSGDLHVSYADTLARLSGTRLFDTVFQRDGEVTVELYRPNGRDKQVPHDRDEIYLIAGGHGTFRREDETIDFAAGDFLHVPAFMEHRFETFSEDFAAWVVFYGPHQQARDGAMHAPLISPPSGAPA